MALQVSCECDNCKSACKYRAGWFMPNQIESLFRFFKTDNIRDLLGKNKLAIDWWNGSNGGDAILVLAPNIVGNGSIQCPAEPRGECVFFKKGLCTIYEVRPLECSAYLHDQKHEEINSRHEQIAKKWQESALLSGFQHEIHIESLSLVDSLFG